MLFPRPEHADGLNMDTKWVVLGPYYFGYEFSPQKLIGCDDYHQHQSSTRVRDWAACFTCADGPTWWWQMSSNWYTATQKEIWDFIFFPRRVQHPYRPLDARQGRKVLHSGIKWKESETSSHSFRTVDSPIPRRNRKKKIEKNLWNKKFQQLLMNVIRLAGSNLHHLCLFLAVADSNVLDLFV